MFFTFLDGAQDFATIFISTFTHQINIDGQNLSVMNIYALTTASYTYYLVSLQTWIFAMKYLESAILCSFKRNCMTPLTVRNIRRVGICVYTVAILVMWILMMATCPGYVNNESID